MEKWVIFWNAGYGESAECINAENESTANDAAYEFWREEAESNADYRAERLTKELAEEYGFDFDEPEPAKAEATDRS